MNWKNAKSGSSVLEVVMHRSGMTEDELLNPKATAPDTIENLPQAAALIQKAISDGTPISVMGDYDADGITASSIMFYLLNALGQDPVIRLPKRMSEGYGLSVTAIKEFKPGLLVTVDNGIAANEAIQEAKRLGFTVIVIDHHLPGETLPPADLIVDPHINPEKNGFVDYCGAGLAYKLAQYMLPDDKALLDHLCTLATVGTIGDAMPLCGDNRHIVIKGLRLLNAKKTTVGMNAIIRAAELYNISEDDIGFKIAPMLNAAGRMLDEGAQVSFNALTTPDAADAAGLATELCAINERRKAATLLAVDEVEGVIAADVLYGDKPLVIYAEGLHEGLVGIITGKLAEKYKVPTFVLTDCADPDILHGSGRSYGGVNLKEDILDKLPDGLVSGGGHADAAGISVKRADFNLLMEKMHATMEDYEPTDQEEIEYDLEIVADDVPKVLKDVQKYAPYGHGCPAPVFLVKNVVLSPRYGQLVKYMGKSAEHIKLHSAQFSAICFGMAEQYKRYGSPGTVDIVGKLSENIWKYSSEKQVEVIDFIPTQKEHRTSSLLEALRANGTI